MTERSPWDDADFAIGTALAEAERVLALVPESHSHTAVRNRIVMTMTELDTARDFLAAARARMPRD